MGESMLLPLHKPSLHILIEPIDALFGEYKSVLYFLGALAQIQE